MIRYFGKFLVGSFIHNPRKGRIGMILKSSNEHELHIAWLSGTKETISLKPSSKRQTKQLQKIQRFKALHMSSFNLANAGLPTRILKVLHANESVTVVLESILIPQQYLDEIGLGKTLLDFLQLPLPVHYEISTTQIGDTLRTLFRFWT